MRVDLTRSGGFGGITRRVSFGPGDLTSAEESTFAQALEAAATGGSEQGVPTVGVDRYQYDVTIVVDDQAHHLRASETEIPSEYRQFLDGLINRQNR